MLTVAIVIVVERAYQSVELFYTALPALAAQTTLGSSPLVCAESLPLVVLTICAYGVHMIVAAALTPEQWRGLHVASVRQPLLSDSVSTSAEISAVPDAHSTGASIDVDAVLAAISAWLTLAVFVGAIMTIAIARERSERAYFRVSTR